mgnify:CR=1 FL=1
MNFTLMLEIILLNWQLKEKKKELKSRIDSFISSQILPSERGQSLKVKLLVLVKFGLLSFL